MELANNFCILMLCLAVCLNVSTQRWQTSFIRELNDKLFDLRRRINDQRTPEQKAEAQKLCKDLEDWRNEEWKIVSSAMEPRQIADHASIIPGGLTELERGLLFTLAKEGRESNEDSLWISNNVYQTGSSFISVPYSELKKTIERLTTHKFCYLNENQEPEYFTILDKRSTPSSGRRSWKIRLHMLLCSLRPNHYFCDTMNLIWSAKAKEIIAAPLAQAIEAGTIKHIDDFVFLRIGCPQPETHKEQSGEQ